MQNPTTAKALYDKLESKRSSYLERARDAAKVTLPYIMPPEGFGTSEALKTPWQSAGARGVNNLSAKLLLALLPPNHPFFKLVINEYKAKEEDGVTDELLAEIDKSLQKVERVAMREVARGKFRTSMSMALKQLIIAGNVLIYAPIKGDIRSFHLDRYVVERDPSGNVLIVVGIEDMAREAIPESMQGLVNLEGNTTTNTVRLYSAQRRLDHKTVEIWQEIDGVLVPDSHHIVPIEDAPFIPLRFTLIDGEDYGRGLIEDYLGDLESLEALTKAIREGAAAASRVLYLVRPNGSTSKRQLSGAPNGGIVTGDADDISTLQLDKYADFQTAEREKRAIEERLNAVFLTATGMVRQAERVTAEEIRMLQQELEVQHGGLYTLLAAEGQLPLARRLLKRLEKSKELPKLPKDLIEPVIVTGVEALGRGNDLAKLDALVNGIVQLFGPDGARTYLNPSELISRRAVALGINTEGLVPSQEEIQAEQQQMQQQALAEKMAGPAVNAGAQLATQQQQPTE